MFKHLISAAVLTVGLSATSASAALYDITEILSFSGGGFTSSLIHDQSYGRMSGKTKARFNSAVTGGQFDTETGAINFGGSIYNGDKTSTFSAMGTLMKSATRENGLFGQISFSFLGDMMNGKTITFHFDDETYTSGGEPNGLASNGEKTYIALWGDKGNYSQKYCEYYHWRCKGMDLRIAYEDNGGGGGVVPLPASFGFLLAGMGGLGVARRLRKTA